MFDKRATCRAFLGLAISLGKCRNHAFDLRACCIYACDMILRLLRSLNRAYPFVVLFGYMGAFVLAFICIFSFPLGALVLIIGSVLSLAFVVFFGEALSGIEGILTRRALKKNRCPACRTGPIQKNAAHFQCLGCGARFHFDGAQLSADEQEACASDASGTSAKLIAVE